jgi:hypothetical protein
MTCNNITIKQENKNLVFKSQEVTMVFKFNGVINTGTGLAAPPRVYNENLTPQITGLTNTFTTAFPLISGSEELKRNGVIQTVNDDYQVINSTTIQFTTIIPKISEHILISYNKQ